MELWIVGKYIHHEANKTAWEFQGVFDDEALANEACLTENYFVAPAVLNEKDTDESQEWNGAYYPKCQSPEKASSTE